MWRPYRRRERLVAICEAVRACGQRVHARPGETLSLISDRFKKKPLELDGEGVAFADDAFYVIGSHGHPRDKDHELDPTNDAKKIRAKILAGSQIIRIRLKPG